MRIGIWIFIILLQLAVTRPTLASPLACEDLFLSYARLTTPALKELSGLLSPSDSKSAQASAARISEVVEKVLPAGPRPSKWWSLRSPPQPLVVSKLILIERLQMLEMLKPLRVEHEFARELIYRLAFENWPEAPTIQEASLTRRLAHEGFAAYFGSPARALPAWQVTGHRLVKLFPLLIGAKSNEVSRQAFRHWMRLLADLKPRENINSLRGFVAWRATIRDFANLTRTRDPLKPWQIVLENSDLIPDREIADAFINALKDRAFLSTDAETRAALSDLGEKLRLRTTETNPLGVKPLRRLSMYDAEEQGMWMDNKIVTNKFYLHPVYLRTPEERAPYKVTILPNGQFLDAQGRALDTAGQLAIYGVDLQGELYVKLSPVKGEFHHSSFVAGQELLAAGEIVIENGRLVRIDNNSGHYHPDIYHLDAFANYLRSRGVAVPEGTVQYF